MRNSRGHGAAAALLLLAACAAGIERDAGPTADWARAEPVAVRLLDYRFEPAEIVLEHGKLYRLRLENPGKEQHEFTAPAFFAAARVRDAARVLSHGGDVVVAPRTTREVELVAPPAGSYELICADHDWAGMTGRIVVR
jgi:uncharacterized cupredoxin-like copper-binding protein